MKHLNKFENYSDDDMNQGEDDKKSKFGVDVKFQGDYRKDALIKKKLVRIKNQVSDDNIKNQIDDILDLLN